MVWDNYLSVGGLEIGNSARAYGYATTTDCPANWLRDPDGPSLADALGDAPYDYDNIESAPWYDPDVDALARRFLGVYVLSMDQLRDSTRSAQVTQRTGDGARIGGRRFASRAVRVQAWLTAAGRDALDYGMMWLSAALTSGNCGQHNSRCGVADAAFFVDVPRPKAEGETDDEYAAAIAPLRRFIHDVDATSGPFTVEERESRDGLHFGRLVEFTIEAEDAFIYGTTWQVPLTPTLPTVVQDTPYNLVPVPSAELAGSSLVVATNYSTNPSVETDATGWLGVAQVVSGADPAPYFTSGRSTELAADGVASMRGRILGNGTTEIPATASTMLLYQDVSLAGVAAGQAVSFNIWGAALISAGTSVSQVTGLEAYIDWKNGSGTVLLKETLGLADSYDGFPFSAPSKHPPAGATQVRVHVKASVVWGSSATASKNSEIRVYADALAVTVP